MVWRIVHYPAGDAPSRDYAVRAPSHEAAEAQARRRPQRPGVDAPVTDKEAP